MSKALKIIWHLDDYRAYLLDEMKLSLGDDLASDSPLLSMSLGRKIRSALIWNLYNHSAQPCPTVF
ncbi:MAG: hypothetical protein CMN98_09305 [Synechococcus sp. NP17]|nr:hypothetical protein [Synechococcus sp. NP17]